MIFRVCFDLWEKFRRGTKTSDYTIQFLMVEELQVSLNVKSIMMAN